MNYQKELEKIPIKNRISNNNIFNNIILVINIDSENK